MTGKSSDLHTHTIYSDGNNTPEEMIRSAISAGLDRIGISDHSYTSFDESYCMKREDYSRYKSDLAALKEKYSGRIEILCGIEQDYYSESPAEGFDYVIGSVHYICCGKPDGVFIPVDESAEILKSAADKYFNGNIYALAAEYFRTVSDVINKTNADIIGHFDLITKFNGNEEYFRFDDPRYLKAAFAGESMARNKYTYYASKAKKEGYNIIAKKFEETADNEKEHAKLWFKLLHGGMPSTEENLKDAASGENYEWTDMYATFAREAREEGFDEIENRFSGKNEKSQYFILFPPYESLKQLLDEEKYDEYIKKELPVSSYIDLYDIILFIFSEFVIYFYTLVYIYFIFHI